MSVDLFSMFGLKDEEQQRLKTAMCALDSLTRSFYGGPVRSKSEADCLFGLIECSKNLGGKPFVIYADQEGALFRKDAQQCARCYFYSRACCRASCKSHYKHVV